MTSAIDTSNINTTYPVPGRDNDSQGFRTNFSAIKNGLATAKDEISLLQSQKADLIQPTFFSNNTPSLSSATGAVTVAGGVGIGQDLNVGGNIYARGNIISSGTLIITTATVGPYAYTTMTDVTFSGTYGQPKLSLSKFVTGNKTFKSSLSVGVENPYTATSGPQGISLLYVGTTVTNQTGVYIRGNDNDGNALVLDTTNDLGTDGDFSFLEFRKSPYGVTATVATIMLGSVPNYPSLEVTGDWHFTGKLTADNAILNAPRNVAGVASVNGSTGTVVLSSLGDFSRSLGLTGYQKFPGGLLMQWGRSNLSSDPGQIINFPVSFTTCFLVNGSLTGADTYGLIGVTTLNTSSFTVNPAEAGLYTWMALGV